MQRKRVRNKLTASAKQRYEEKLSDINNIDRYELPAAEWDRDLDHLPPCTYMDIVNYLVFGISHYTMQEFKSHKPLESYETFCCGWVQDLAIYKPPNAQNTGVMAKVMHSRRLCEPPLTPWVILTPSGQCTVKGEGHNHRKPAYWKLPSSINKVLPEVGHRINFISAAATRRSLNKRIDGETHNSPALRTRPAKTAKDTPTPTPEQLAVFYREISMTGTRSAILSVLPEYCDEFRDPILPIRSLQSLANGSGLDRSDLNRVGASPDAIVTCTCCRKGCIEVKCPAKYKDSTILDACSSDDRNFCLHVVDGQVHLKKNHQYYTQKAQDFFVKVALPELVVQYFSIPPTSQASPGPSVLRELLQAQTVVKRPRKQSAKNQMVACDNQNCRMSVVCASRGRSNGGL
ncbi:uncharacterized protein LOC114459273 [Scomber scombrus]|uniref:Uncharacterized protein LOC114459273 n=1 Tax=Scomber scombrus TaxID=13677 RepID=A0AAV1PRH1_SCOSC